MRSFLVAAAASIAAAQYTCNFLTDSGVSCMLPWPDNFFLASTFTPGKAGLSLAMDSLPQDGLGDAVDPAAGGWNDLQGFSPLGPLVASLPGLNLDLSGLPRLWNISSSGSPTSVLLNTVTGQPVWHWTEVDHSGDGSSLGDEKAFIAWPATRLNDTTRYIFALRNLVDDNGIPLAPSDGFRALRDNIPSNNPALEASRPRFEAIFSTLSSLGWDRTSLTLAWDFTINTREDITTRMLHMRDDASARIAALGPGAHGTTYPIPYNITSVDKNPDVNTSIRIHGQFYVPTYLPYRAVPASDSRLVLDPVTKLPLFQEFVPFDFEVIIPPSVVARVAAGGPPAKIVTYGHGLFGDHGEVEVGYLSAEAEANGWIVAATDWIGLSEYDEATVAVMLLTNFTNFAMVPDRLHQGMLNTLMLNKLLTQSEFRWESVMMSAGAPMASNVSTDWHYTGNSQGGIMGGVYMAASSEVLTGVCGVPGGPYSLLLPRSTDFGTLFDILKARYPRSIDRTGMLAAIQALWDRMDPGGWAAYITNPANPLPGTPPKRVIWHYGLGDAQVTWLGAHAVAHSAGAVMFASQVHDGNETLAQFDKVPDTTVITSGNAIMGWDYGFPLVPFINVPPSDGIDAHECPRRTPAAQQQMAHFFVTGEIINTCNGPCVTTHPDGCGT